MGVITKQRPARYAAIFMTFEENRIQVTAYQVQAMTMLRNGGNHINSPEFNITGIVAIEPCYGEDGGNAARIHYRHGRVITEKCRVKTYLQRIASHFGFDLIMLRQNCGNYLGCPQPVPLPFSPYLVLVPLKMRTPLFAKDGAFGYVNIESVKEIKETGNVKDHTLPKCNIILEEGSSLPGLHSRKVTERNLKNGELARDYFCSLQRRNLEAENMMVMEKAQPEALNTLVSIHRLLYELLAEKDEAKRERMRRLIYFGNNWN